jgi:hypothetical protein
VASGTGVIGACANTTLRALTNAEVFLKSSEDAAAEPGEESPQAGSYFDMTWYTGRL